MDSLLGIAGMIAVQIAGVILSPSHSPCCVAAGLLRTTHETCKSSYQASLLLLGRQRPSKRIAGAINDEDHRILVMSATAFGLVATGDSGQPDALAVEVGSAATAAGRWHLSRRLLSAITGRLLVFIKSSSSLRLVPSVDIVGQDNWSFV